MMIAVYQEGTVIKSAFPTMSLLLAALILTPALTSASPRAKSLLQLRQAAGAETPPQIPAVKSDSSEPQTTLAEEGTPANSSEARNPEVSCYGLAREKLSATPWGAVMLCAHTPSASAPVSCYSAARSRLSSIGSVLLCTGASSASAPVACYDKAVRLSLTALGAATLCRGARSADGPIACFNEARQHLNIVGSVQLCGIPFELYDQIYGKDDSKDPKALLFKGA